MSDLNSMMFGPMGNAYLAGQRMTDDDLENQKKLLANQQSERMNPLLVTHQDLANQTTQAQLPGVVGNSQSLAAKGELDQAVNPQAIDAKKMDFMTKMGDDELKQMGNWGAKVGHIGTMIEGSGPLSMQQMQELGKQYGIDFKSPQLAPIMQMGMANPQALPQLLQTIGKKTSEMSTDYLQKRALADSHNASQERIHTGNNTTSENVARIGADAKITVASNQAQIKADHPKLMEQIAQLSSIPKEKRTPEQTEALTNLLSFVYSKQVLGNPALAPEMMKGVNPTTPLERVKDVVKDATGAQAPAGAAASKEVMEALQKMGAPYEPDKYKYRIGPNGVLEKAPKVKGN